MLILIPVAFSAPTANVQEINPDSLPESDEEMLGNSSIYKWNYFPFKFPVVATIHQIRPEAVQNCADCTAAGIAANGQFKIRLCIPPAGSGCVYSSFSCPGNAYERTWCQETTTEEPTTTTTAAATWSAWSCMCCGGCLTARCTRTCQSSGTTTCSGNPVKEDPLTSCTAPSPVCKFPLATCCDGRVPYVNATARARWCN
uniref:Uncharacterized protein n=1 Tax=Panagrolaimus sp. JU765 TaxID=591449 RepID=A0AC34Q4J0_9BILA